MPEIQGKKRTQTGLPSRFQVSLVTSKSLTFLLEPNAHPRKGLGFATERTDIDEMAFQMVEIMTNIYNRIRKVICIFKVQYDPKHFL